MPFLGRRLLAKTLLFGGQRLSEQHDSFSEGGGVVGAQLVGPGRGVV